jgi:magnesium transporter
MSLFGHVFFSEVVKRAVFDAKGDVAGRFVDVVVIRGEPLPKISFVLIKRHGQLYRVPWDDFSIFSRRILSIQRNADSLDLYEGDDDLLLTRDILDKQIVDVNGAKVVRVNDVRLEGHNGQAILSAVDVGIRGLLRRLGAERRTERILAFFKSSLPWNLITWNYIQPLNPKLKTITLTIPRQMVAALHPADLAEIINQVSREEGATLFTDLDTKTAAEALSEVEPQRQAELISGLDAERAADIIEEMPPDEASDVLGDLPTDKAKDILERVEEDEAKDIQELLAYDEDTAGGLMTTDYISYGPETTVGEAMERFRTDAATVGSVYQIYLTKDHREIVGAVSLKELLIAERSATLGSIADRKPRTASPETKEKALAALMAKYDLVALPIVNQARHILGVVTIDDVITQFSPSSGRRKRRGT